jgi:hypothetical protein
MGVGTNKRLSGSLEDKTKEYEALDAKVRTIKSVALSDEWIDEQEAKIRNQQPSVLKRAIADLLLLGENDEKIRNKLEKNTVATGEVAKSDSGDATPPSNLNNIVSSPGSDEERMM